MHGSFAWPLALIRGEVRRYRAAGAQPAPDGSVTHRYLTTSEIEADEPAAIVAALGAGLASGAVAPGTVLDPVSAAIAIYERA